MVLMIEKNKKIKHIVMIQKIKGECQLNHHK